MDLGIKGRTALVCASSRGLGLGTARALAQAGCTVVMNGRDEAVLRRAAEALAEAQPEARIVPVAADLGTPAGRARLLEAAGAVDILITNNAGPPFRDFRALDDAAVLAGVEANMAVPLALIRAVIDPMAARGFGRIVNIVSSSVKAPIAGLDLSSAARAGLVAFLAGVCRTVADKGVTINHVLPGAFDTDRLRSGFQRTADQTGKTMDEVAAARRATIPARRFGTPEEFGALCAFLCSAQAGYITGQSFLIDGGMVNSTF